MHEIMLVSASSLAPAVYNPREADTARLNLVRLSLQKLGFLLPLLVTPEGEILSGHQRHKVAVEMGAKLLPVIQVDVPQHKRHGLNILCNRATNDIPVINTEADMTAELAQAHVASYAAALPDVTPDTEAFWACCNSASHDVQELARPNVRNFIRQAGNVGSMLRNFGVHMPIVIDPSGRVINGIGRLEAAARKGQPTIRAITVSNEQAELARHMLNLLSMDFTFTGDNADRLRFGSFRRLRLRRKSFGTAFVLPVFKSRRNADLDLLNPAHRSQWIAACGEQVLDFGSGHGDEARMLRSHGINVTAFEPFPLHQGTPSREMARASALAFLQAVRTGQIFSSVFLSSVLNSVPFPEDRRHVVRLCAALCSRHTVLYAAARGTHCPNWKMHESGELLSSKGGTARNFKVAHEQGVTIGDLGTVPKLQKFYSREEFTNMFDEFFSTVQVGKKGTSVTAICKNTLPIRPSDLAASIRFEFNLPYPCGKRLGLTRQALQAFSHRLGMNLEAE